MRKFISLMLVAFMLGTLLFSAGCGQKPAETPKAGEPAKSEPAKQEPAKKFRVGLLLPGTINDQGWNATAYAGLMKIKEGLGAEVAFAEKVAPSDYEEVFRGYASQGYDVVFGHGFEFGDAAKKVAKEFPKVKFIVTSTTIFQEPNVSSIKNDSLQQGFLAGVVAGLLTKSNVIGSVGGMEIPPITEYNKGFEMGSKYVNPKVKALTAITGSFDDAAKAKETAVAMIKQGADIVTHDADQAGLGVIEAAKANKVPAIGAVGDQASLAPDLIITSALNDMAKAFVVAAKMAKDGSLKPQSYTMGVKEGVVGLAPFRNFEGKLTAEQKAKIQEVLKDLETGKLDVWAMAKK